MVIRVPCIAILTGLQQILTGSDSTEIKSKKRKACLAASWQEYFIFVNARAKDTGRDLFGDYAVSPKD